MPAARGRQTNGGLIATSRELWAKTVEEIEGIRRHAAEIGDYAKAARWLRIEQRVAARVSTPVVPDREGLRREVAGD
jgi:hypothetical protein